MTQNAPNGCNAIIVVDLGFGDAGKGGIVDFLTRRHHAHTVVRFNGGAQAAHNVITPDGRRHHTFAQFGSGTFIRGVRTYLSRFMLVEPYAMFNEEQHLHELGLIDVFRRTLIDRQALIITPYHIAANRLKERARGTQRHGSCGMGIGETMSDFLDDPENALVAGDLPNQTRVIQKLKRVREKKYAEVQDLLTDQDDIFGSADLIEIAAENYAYLATQVQLVDETALHRILNEQGTIIFEGAQGVLLDENYGFAPFTTWSTTTFANALTLLDGYDGEVTRLGVLRSYFVRHGAGPFVTEDSTLTLPEPHNVTSEWQQHFRVGHFDAVAARYALEVVGGVDRLAITHLDRVGDVVKICEAYRGNRSDFFEQADGHITKIKVCRPPNWEYQKALTEQLWQCTPVYRTVEGAEYLAYLEELLGIPITIKSTGPTAADKQC